MLWLRLISDVCAALHYGISRWGSNSHRGWSHDRARIPGSWDDLAPAGRWGPGSNDRSRDLGSRWDRPSHWNWLLSSWDICSHFSAIVPLARQGTEDRRARYAPQREGTQSIKFFGRAILRIEDNTSSERVLEKLGMVHTSDNPQGYNIQGKPISTKEFEMTLP